MSDSDVDLPDCSDGTTYHVNPATHAPSISASTGCRTGRRVRQG